MTSINSSINQQFDNIITLIERTETETDETLLKEIKDKITDLSDKINVATAKDNLQTLSNKVKALPSKTEVNELKRELQSIQKVVSETLPEKSTTEFTTLPRELHGLIAAGLELPERNEMSSKVPITEFSNPIAVRESHNWDVRRLMPIRETLKFLLSLPLEEHLKLYFNYGVTIIPNSKVAESNQLTSEVIIKGLDLAPKELENLNNLQLVLNRINVKFEDLDKIDEYGFDRELITKFGLESCVLSEYKMCLMFIKVILTNDMTSLEQIFGEKVVLKDQPFFVKLQELRDKIASSTVTEISGTYIPSTILPPNTTKMTLIYLDYIPKSIYRLPLLEDLTLKYLTLPFSKLPPEISNLTSLKILNLANNSWLAEFPKLPPNLTSLDISHTAITSIPEELIPIVRKLESFKHEGVVFDEATTKALEG